MTARSLVAAIDAAIEQLQNSIRELVRTRALLVQQYDEADIEAALAEGECVVCGPGECVCHRVSRLIEARAAEAAQRDREAITAS